MTRFLYTITTTTFLLLGFISQGQIENDSATYWVNEKYITCIDSGKSICNCQEKNNFLILHIDTFKNTLTIKPSIYYSWETLEFDIKPDTKNSFTIMPDYGIDTLSVLKLNETQLTLTSPEQTIVFTQIRAKRIDNWTQGDLWRQIGVINCKPLLTFSISPCNDNSNLLLTHTKLSDLIARGQITISCSDDYHYNTMHIRDSDSSFFMLYESDKVKIYKMSVRDRGEKVDISKLYDCQLFSIKK